jgi:glycosyltransferase involved in cell wall biosynthesis
MKNEISVIVPVYNGEKDIRKTLLSLIDQTLPVDIIVVNDGSKDNTEMVVKQLIEEHPETNIHYFYKENGGISDARNFGISKVETPYFGFLDSDDNCISNAFELLYNALKKEDAKIAFGGFTWVYEDGSTRISMDTGYRDKKELIIKMYNTLWNKLYDTKWFKSTGIVFPKGLRYEDTSCLTKLALFMDKVAYVEVPLVNYIQHPGSITHTYNHNISDMIQVFEGIRQFYREHDAYDEYREEIEYVVIRFFLGSNFLRASRIADKTLKKQVLDEAWNYLNDNYPDYRKNKYLKQGGLKNLYFKHCGKFVYYNCGWLLRKIIK